MMKQFFYILLGASLLLSYPLQAQTPYDSFSPETWRPMLDMGVFEQDDETHLEPDNQVSYDTILCAAVIDRQEQVLLLVDIESLSVLAFAPLNDDLHKWISPDPLLDKYIHSTPYIYCNGNPIIYIDPDGCDWYEAEDGTAVLWKNSNDASIHKNGVKYNNIGENYNHVVGNTTYEYHQNELASIEYTTNTEFYQQPTGTSCKVTCNLMIESAGYTPELGREGEILMTTHNENGVVNGATKDWRLGVNRLDNYLQNGMPCIVGVDYKAQQQHNLAPHGDGMTDHFLTVVGMRINIQGGTTLYRFYDPGSVRGASPSNVMTLVGTFLQGKTAAHSNPFKVTTIRRTK